MLERVPDVLRERFGHAGFRVGQREIVEAVLAGHDVLGVLPTGTGKSLCYQLPALLVRGLVVVVSPLVALMKDQVEALEQRGIEATTIHSGLSEDAQTWRLRRVEAGFGRLLYLAPERLRHPAVLDALARRGVEVLAVDEAHCISSWGHDFRPSYRRLGEVAERLRPRVRLALTATASPAVRADIVRSLCMSDPVTFVGGFFRPNLVLTVRPTRERDRLEAAREVVGQGPAILYAATRAQAEAVAADMGTACYHAGLPHDVRNRVQDDFVRGRSNLIVATNAFGLGVDKPDIRAVVHLQMPGSLEAYTQEIGRGGRDGERCRCVLLYARGDEALQRSLAEKACADPAMARRLVDQARAGRLCGHRLEEVPGVGPRDLMRARDSLAALGVLGVVRVGDFGHVELRDDNLDVLDTMRRHRLRRLQQVRRMSAFARMWWGCRHATIVGYFGQHLPRGRCGACDHCLPRDVVAC